MKKVIYICLGIIMVVIGAIGAIMPVLPTTIFLILAAFFFSHSSPNFYNKLIGNKVFGPIIINFKEHRGITQRDRLKAVVTIWIVFGVSILISQDMIFASILIIIGVIHTIFLYRMKVL